MKMHSKRFISSVVASTLLVLSCLSQSNRYAFALLTKGKAGENAYWEWDQDTQTITISGTGSMNNYEYKGIELTQEEGGGTTFGITAPWRPYIGKVKNVIISNGITSIGAHSFYDSSNNSVVIPSSVTQVGSSAFSSRALRSVTVLNPNTELPKYSLFDLFYREHKDEEVIYGFKGSTAEVYAEQYDIPFKALKTTGRCGDQISWKYDAESQALSLSGTGAMNDYSEENRPPWYPYINEINSISLSEGIVSIGNYAFNKLSFLENVEIPNTVQMIGNNAFANCSNIISITMTSGPDTIGKEAFSDCVNLKQIAIPEGVKTIEEGAFYGCSSLTSIITPLSTSCIDENAFSHCTHLAEITILNPEANIFNSQSTISDSDEGYFGIIHGYKNSTASKYAWEYECEFIPLEFEISFDANGGSGTMATETIEPDPYYTLPENKFTAAKGYRFLGWGFNGKQYQIGDMITITENTTLKALWIKEGEVVAGDLNGSDTVTVADAVLLLRFVTEDLPKDECPIEPALDAVDLDKDKLLTIIDVCLLLKQIMK